MSKYFDQANMFMEPDTKQHGSHMVMTNVVKPTKTKYLTIDTRFRDGYDSNTNANYNISLPERVNNVRSMQLRNIEIPMTFYNISSSLGNNIIIFKILNNETTIVIPDNQYDSTTLVAEINSLLTNLGSPFSTIQISIIDNKTILSNIGMNPCIVTFDESSSLNPCDSMMSRLGWKLGFRKKSYTLESNINLKSESFVDLHGPRYLYLILDEFKNGNPHSFLSLSKTSQLSSQQILARIAIDYDKYPFGSILPAEQYNYALSDTRRYANEVDLQRFNIRLVDEFGKILDLNGTDVSMCLELEHL